MCGSWAFLCQALPSPLAVAGLWYISLATEDPTACKHASERCGMQICEGKMWVQGRLHGAGPTDRGGGLDREVGVKIKSLVKPLIWQILPRAIELFVISKERRRKQEITLQPC